jgi:hypothetical protein
MSQTTSTTTLQLLQAQADWLRSTNPEKRSLVTLSVYYQADAHTETACPPSMLAVLVLVCRNSDLSLTSAMLRDPAPQCIILKCAPTWRHNRLQHNLRQQSPSNGSSRAHSAHVWTAPAAASTTGPPHGRINSKSTDQGELCSEWTPTPAP